MGITHRESYCPSEEHFVKVSFFKLAFVKFCQNKFLVSGHSGFTSVGLFFSFIAIKIVIEL